MWIVIGIICAIIILTIFILASRQCDNIDDPSFEMGSWIVGREGKGCDERVFQAEFPEGSLVDDYHVIAVFGRIPPVPYWGINIYHKGKCQGDGITALSEISPEAGFAVLFGTNLTLIERVRCDIEQHWQRSFREHHLQVISYPLPEEDVYNVRLSWIGDDTPRLSLRRYSAAHNFPVMRSHVEGPRKIRSRYPRESDVIPLEQWNVLYAPPSSGVEGEVAVSKLEMPHRHVTALESRISLHAGERLLILVADHGQTSRARIAFLKVELDDRCWIRKTSTDPSPNELRIGIALYSLGPFPDETNVVVKELLYSEPQTKLGPSLASILPMRIWRYPAEIPLPREANKIL